MAESEPLTVRVAPDGIDLTVMGNEAVGMGPFPAGQGIGGESGVDHGNGCLVGFALQIFIESAQLAHQEHSFIDNGPGGQGTDIGIFRALLKFPADNVEPAVKVDSSENVRRSLQEALPDGRHAVPGRGAQDLRMDRYFPPADDGNPFFFSDHFEQPSGEGALQVIAGQEEHTDSVVSRFSDFHLHPVRRSRKERMGNLQQDTDAVSDCAAGVLTCPVFQFFYD